MAYTNLKPGTRGLLRAFKSHKLVLSKQGRGNMAKSIKTTRTVAGNNLNKKMIIRAAAGVRKRRGLTGTP